MPHTSHPTSPTLEGNYIWEVAYTTETATKDAPIQSQEMVKVLAASAEEAMAFVRALPKNTKVDTLDFWAIGAKETGENILDARPPLAAKTILTPIGGQ